jgi:crossover junction endodeoxyribonuclease RuvC
MLACAQAGHSPMEYTPMQVKRSVTGRGAADKEQVQHMVRAILEIEETPQFFDATDALAVAICHAVNGKPPAPGKRGGATSKRQAWADFVKANPAKVRKP